MKRQRVKIIVFILIIMSIGAFYFISTKSKKQVIIEENLELKGQIINCVERFNEDKTKNVLRIKDIDNVEWNTLYIVSPYTKLDKFMDEYKLSSDRSINSEIEINDGINLLLLTKKNKVISYLNHERKKGDFTYLNKLNNCYSKEDTVFYINSSERWIYFSKYPQ